MGGITHTRVCISSIGTVCVHILPRIQILTAEVIFEYYTVYFRIFPGLLCSPQRGSAQASAKNELIYKVNSCVSFIFDLNGQLKSYFNLFFLEMFLEASMSWSMLSFTATCLTIIKQLSWCYNDIIISAC